MDSILTTVLDSWPLPMLKRSYMPCYRLIRYEMLWRNPPGVAATILVVSLVGVFAASCASTRPPPGTSLPRQVPAVDAELFGNHLIAVVDQDDSVRIQMRFILIDDPPFVDYWRHLSEAFFLASNGSLGDEPASRYRDCQHTVLTRLGWEFSQAEFQEVAFACLNQNAFLATVSLHARGTYEDPPQQLPASYLTQQRQLTDPRFVPGLHYSESWLARSAFRPCERIFRYCNRSLSVGRLGDPEEELCVDAYEQLLAEDSSDGRLFRKLYRKWEADVLQDLRDVSPYSSKAVTQAMTSARELLRRSGVTDLLESRVATLRHLHGGDS